MQFVGNYNLSSSYRAITQITVYNNLFLYYFNFNAYAEVAM